MSTLSRELSDLAGSWTYLETVFPFVNNGASQLICKSNPLRWALVISGAWQLVGGAGVFAVSTVPGNTTNGLGVILNQYNPSRILDYRTWGGLVQQPLYAALKGASGNISLDVIEILSQQ